jgi:hypothetical protein
MHMSALRMRSLASSFVPVLAVVALTGALLASAPRVARAAGGERENAQYTVSTLTGSVSR